MSMIRFTRTAALFVVLSALLPQLASAMRAWARQYSLRCAAGHSAMPRLNAFGEYFAGNNFRNIKLAIGANADLLKKQTVDPPLVGHPSRENYLLVGFNAAF